MEKLAWSKDISLNNAMLDNQHMRLFEIANQLIENANTNTNPELISETLHNLLQYSKLHFKAEELYLQSINYPKIEDHIKEHSSFVYQIAMFCKDVSEGKSDLSAEMLDYLVVWIREHTSKEGADFRKYNK